MIAARILTALQEYAATVAKATNVTRSQFVGSYLIDPETAKDVDVLVLVSNACIVTDARWSFGKDWLLPDGEYDDRDDRWCAIRKGDLNLILTNDTDWYDRAALANEVCVALGLQDKGDRIVAYRVIRDGLSAAAAACPWSSRGPRALTTCWSVGRAGFPIAASGLPTSTWLCLRSPCRWPALTRTCHSPCSR